MVSDQKAVLIAPPICGLAEGELVGLLIIVPSGRERCGLAEVKAVEVEVHITIICPGFLPSPDRLLLIEATASILKGFMSWWCIERINGHRT